MSHQSLEDLIDFSGTSAEGKVLKYTSSSTSWGPEDSSGGAGGPTMLEIWDEGSTDAKSAHPLYVGDSAVVAHNSIAASRVAKKGDLASSYFSGGGSAWDDDTFFILPSATAKYLLILEYMVRYGSSSDASNTLNRGLGHSDAAPAISSIDEKIGLAIPNNYGTYTADAGITMISPWDTSYKWHGVVDYFELSANSTSGRAVTPVYKCLINNDDSEYGFKGTGGSSSSQVTLLHKKIKLIQLV